MEAVGDEGGEVKLMPTRKWSEDSCWPMTTRLATRGFDVSGRGDDGLMQERHVNEACLALR